MLDLLIIKFANKISQQEVCYFRGAVIHSLEKSHVLFHNHDGAKFIYSYPMIQYKRIKGKAAIVCVKQGTEEIGALFAKGFSDFILGERKVDIVIEKIIPYKYNVHIWEQIFTYRINRWIPLNKENYKKYKELETVIERVSFLNKILIGNILSFAKGIGVNFSKEISCEITDVLEKYIVKIKGIKMQCFDIEFNSNVSIPDYIGLGKHVSINYGVVTKVINKEL